MSGLLWVVAVVLVVVGMAGVVLPALPGAVLVFAGLVVAAWADGFERVGWGPLALLAVMTVLVYAVEFAASALGAKRLGASRRAVWGAALGAIAGMFFGLVGIVVGPFVGAVVGEITLHRGLGQAGRAGAGAWIGLVLGGVAKIALVFVMLGIFGAAYVY